MGPDRAVGCDTEPDARLLRVAARQYGVVTRRQAIALGLTRTMIETRLRRGRLQRVHPGVYCVGGSAPTFEQRVYAAAAWAGPGSVVSHSAAAHLWRMVDRPPPVSDVWTARRRTRPPAGICPHFTNDLSRRDRGKLRNIPVTSPVRTLIDLAGQAPEGVVESALANAIVERRVTATALRIRLAQMSRQGVVGPRVLRRLLTHSGGRTHAVSPLERLVAAALTSPDLPPLHREFPVYVEGGVYYLDFAFPHFRVAVEADGRRWHSDSTSFERDRVRHNDLAAAGWRVLRVTERQVRADPNGVRDHVLRLLVRG